MVVNSRDRLVISDFTTADSAPLAAEYDFTLTGGHGSLLKVSDASNVASIATSTLIFGTGGNATYEVKPSERPQWENAFTIDVKVTIPSSGTLDIGFWENSSASGNPIYAIRLHSTYYSIARGTGNWIAGFAYGFTGTADVRLVWTSEVFEWYIRQTGSRDWYRIYHEPSKNGYKRYTSIGTTVYLHLISTASNAVISSLSYGSGQVGNMDYTTYPTWLYEKASGDASMYIWSFDYGTANIEFSTTSASAITTTDLSNLYGSATSEPTYTTGGAFNVMCRIISGYENVGFFSWSLSLNNMPTQANLEATMPAGFFDRIFMIENLIIDTGQTYVAPYSFWLNYPNLEHFKMSATSNRGCKVNADHFKQLADYGVSIRLKELTANGCVGNFNNMAYIPDLRVGSIGVDNTVTNIKNDTLANSETLTVETTGETRQITQMSNGLINGGVIWYGRKTSNYATTYWCNFTINNTATTVSGKIADIRRRVTNYDGTIILTSSRILQIQNSAALITGQTSDFPPEWANNDLNFRKLQINIASVTTRGFTIDGFPDEWNGITVINLQNSAATQTELDAVLDWAYRNRMNFVSSITMNLTGNSQPPSGTYQAVANPSTGLEKLYTLVNDNNSEGFYKWTISYTP